MGCSNFSSGGRNLLDSRFEHDSCGVGFVTTLHGRSEHEILRLTLTALGRLAHRGAIAADGKSSDGVGIQTAVPRNFLLTQSKMFLRPEQPLAVGMLFFPQDEDQAQRDAQRFKACIYAQGFEWLGWRDVPVAREVLGEIALACMPVIRMALMTTADDFTDDPNELESRLFQARKAFERGGGTTYVCSLSTRTLVYKALCTGRTLRDFYLDLQNPQYTTHFAVFHQRYATNVLPTWDRAQPLRMVAHNGEINTVWSNRAHVDARSSLLPRECDPLFTREASDSMSLDEVAELLCHYDRNIAEAVRMMLPPAVGIRESAFHRYHSDIMEPWDGPSALVFTDGRLLGAALDRNGLRPCRFIITDSGLVLAGSEVGLADVDTDTIIRSGRLGPGQMILLDLERSRLIEGDELDRYFDDLAPFSELIDDVLLEPSATPVASLEKDDLTRLQRGFGYTKEEVKMVVGPMALESKEAIWSMGDDTPIAALAHTPRPLYGFFRQRFAQVTNPPIDSLRESCVVSLRTRLGPWPHLLDKHAPVPGLTLPSPFLSLGQMAALHEGVYPLREQLPLAHLNCTFADDATLKQAVLDLQEKAVALVSGGVRALLMTDRTACDHVLPIPMAMATGAVHHALIQAGLRTKVGLVVEAGDCRDVHHAAVLIGYGAGSVSPWLALQTARALAGEEGESRLLHAFDAGIAKIMSKMGISVLDSYRFAQLFDVLGLDAGDHRSLLPWHRVAHGRPKLCRHRSGNSLRPGSPSPKSPIFPTTAGYVSVAPSVSEPHTLGAATYARFAGCRRRRTSAHAGRLWRWLRQRRGRITPSATAGQEPAVLRDLLQINAAGPALDLAEVEPPQSLVKRFIASAMSLGSLSPEAHQTITIAMNMLGARSNTGEGGEDPAAYMPDGNDKGVVSLRNNKIKQVASGRFGVTAQYLVHADELEIKIAQGSKPGEGGQLPGHKVSELIARLRHSQPGVSLISPPPHHDIYSIEDLAQLIYDLKRINPRAPVGVKLVSQLGVGTVAAGVAKAYADYIVVSGHSGGTGASPLSSIKHAGNPWELGLSEAQQVLRANGLRGRVRLRTDGGLSTARDVLIAALLGADEFSFGTAVLVSLGCDMARQCHLNTCPTGIATQKPELRAKFRGKPEHVVRFFMNIAEDLQRLLASLGLPSLQAAIGRTALLEQVRHDGKLDLKPMLAQVGDGPLSWQGGRNMRPEDRPPIDDAWVNPALSSVAAGRPFELSATVRNEDRSLGARLSGELALLRTAQPHLQPDIHFRLRGTAGQSFGSFAGEGMKLVLEGQANDFVGKGLSGGELVIRTRGKLARAESAQVIVGNVALYGATAGYLFAVGSAGERFAIRNSGATAVIEGVGDHACEYMTGGAVLVLGPTGTNFGAGMTGGLAFIWDPDQPLREGEALPSLTLWG